MSEENSNSNMSEVLMEKVKENSKDDRKRLKILAFHGYRQNGAVFRGKIGSFRKAVAKYAQLTFLSAPHRVVNEEGGGDDDSRSWWFNAEDNTFSGKCLGGPALGFEATLRVVERAVADHGPFDGLMGFSQGACLVGLLAAMQQKGYLPYTFKFAIFASGFRSGSLVHKGFYDEEINLPSLHVYGEGDSIIPKDSRSWWFNAEDNTFSGKCLGGPALGFEATLRVVERAVADHGPFDGLMGFSQGACLVGLLAAMQQKGYLPYTFKFAIFASGFRSGSLVHKGFYDEEINLPSLHVYGEGDSIIPKEMSESLISLFTKPVVAEHSGGHYVACSGSIKDAYQDFLHDRCQDDGEDEESPQDEDMR